MLPSLNPEDDCNWGSRTLYLMVLIGLATGSTLFTNLVPMAISYGAAGYMVGYVLTFLFIGIPLLYMEFIVSQFTKRDCIDVWKARSCFSHIGYIQISWQIFLVFYNHTLTSFIIHYFLISFEDPIPYHSCDKSWATKSCDIAKTNYTVHEQCLKKRPVTFLHCDLLPTFPEIQYWENFILGINKNHYYISWRVCLASGIACAVTYLSCFKRNTSIKWFIWFFTIFPALGYFMILIGSMMQTGLVEKFEEGIDANFSVFFQYYRISDIIKDVLYTLNIGSGIAFNLSASTSFRAPCYSNVVITAVVCAAFAVLMICTITMITCPYAYEFNTKSFLIMKLRATHIFEKIPRLLKEFERPAFWLILFFSCNAVLGLSTNTVIISSLLQTFAAKYAVIDNYIGLVTFGVTVLLFLLTIPLLGNYGVNGLSELNKFVRPITIFNGIIESIVFVVWYGADKFAEDVHFMQGIQPTAYMKLAWVTSSFVLAYVFCREMYVSYFRIPFVGLGRVSLILYLVLIILTTPVKMVVAACKKKFGEAIKLDPMWGPRSEVLMRSRAMFSAQAMTKEYMYRQYHLQAGIIARQRSANVRRDQTNPI